MDMGFHRRALSASDKRQDAQALAVLLSKLAARQAASPTALAVTGAESFVEQDATVQPEIATFDGSATSNLRAKAAVSFHPGVSATLRTQCKSL
jgi:hypothetical protein